MKNFINKITINGYKSIKKMELELKSKNILIGGNGAGKSNLLSFFDMLDYLKRNKLQTFVQEQGGINKILYNGRKETTMCDFSITTNENNISAVIKPTTDENAFLEQSNMDNDALKSIGIYHFHDTSVSSLMKATCNINDNIELASDGRNIAAILYLIQETNRESYDRIISVIQMVTPYFETFILRPNPFNKDTIRLEWKKKDCDIPFGAEQLSDGTLRFICLATLFCQPEELRKEIVFVDEPELGLHPMAITIITELLKKYAVNRQVIAATQSIEFMNEFRIDDIIIVENQNGASNFSRPIKEEFTEWLDDYSLGELWQKNVIGGRP